MDHRTNWALVGLALVAGLSVAARADDGEEPKVGYHDTPFLPGSRWRVHDGRRPQPRVVDPGPASASRAKPPSDALVLFDGTDLARWTGPDDAAQWAVRDGYAEVNGTGSIRTRDEFGDVQVHLEFRSPTPAAGDGQGRGNSGVFLMGRYEIQILDSYENPTYPDGQAAALYGQEPPLVNASRPPGAWQTYDIVFTAPRFDGDELREPATATVFHNGVLVHHAQPFLGATRHRTVAQYERHPPRGPIELQDHGDPVRFRNVWVRPLDPNDTQVDTQDDE